MNLGMPEMIFIFLLALVVVGPRKLPELGRQLGKALAEFKRASNEFKNQLETEMMNIELESVAKPPEQAPRVSPDPTILPVEKLYEGAISAPPGSVSRGQSEDISDEAGSPAPAESALPTLEPSSNSTSARPNA